MLRTIAITLTCVIASPALACDTALVLAVDVSGSISAAEYDLQMQGLADALQDPEIIKALVQGQDALALVQWSGDRFQQLSLPRQTLRSAADVANLAAVARTTDRPREYTDTTIGNAILFSLAQFATAPSCRRNVIDVSGDGKENDGMTLPAARASAEAAAVTINGVAIEIDGTTTDLTDYYRAFVMTPDGFVLTARGLQDYPRAIHEKLLRELTKAVS